MTIVTKRHIDQYCRSLGIDREELTTCKITNGIGTHFFDQLYFRIFSTNLDNVTEIDRCTFFYCTSLKSITIPDSVTKIGDGAFEGCHALRSISIPDGIRCIGEYFFKECSSLTSITIPDSVTEICNRAFWNCSSLKSISIPGGVIKLGSFAFSDCTSLTSINISDGVTEIGMYTFNACTSLTSIIIPDSITTIDQWAFTECTALTQIICNNPNLFTDDNIENKDQIQFISTTDYFNDNYLDFLNAVSHSGFNSDHISSKELNLIIKLHQKNYHPKWNTIVSSFENRSLDQIYAILEFFNKTNCMTDLRDQFSFVDKKNQRISFPDKMFSMFFTAKDHVKLSLTAKHVIFKPKKRRQQSASTSEQEHGLTSFCAIQ